MDWIAGKGTILEAVKKYRFVFLVILAGVFLMALPEREEKPQTQAIPEEVREGTLEESLADILSLIEGAGKVRVLLTEAAGAETLFQTDSDMSTSDKRTETVLITGSDRDEEGLVRRVDPPVYQGAVVLCQGADSPAIRLAIVEAVADATGLRSDQISVLKMK